MSVVTNPVTPILEARTSTTRYQPGSSITNDQIIELIRCATLAPSAYNLQNWRFIAVVSDAAKARLCDASYGQQQVKDAAVTFIVCGTTGAHNSLGKALQASVDAEIISAQVQTSWVDAATASHQDNPQLQRDEAFRSASLAAMTLMISAQGMGLTSGAMSGFDEQALRQTFELANDELPVMLITVGYSAGNNWPQKCRLPIKAVLRFA